MTVFNEEANQMMEPLRGDPRVDFEGTKPSMIEVNDPTLPLYGTQGYDPTPLEDVRLRIYPRSKNTGQRAQAIVYMVERGHKLDWRGLAETLKEFQAIGYKDSFYATLEKLWEAGILDASDLPALAAKLGVVIELPEGQPLWAHDVAPASTYCGTCKSDPCRVDSGELCCHDMARYGHCQHEQPTDSTDFRVKAKAEWLRTHEPRQS